MNEHNKSLIIGVVIAVVLLVGGYFLYTRSTQSVSQPTSQPTVTTTSNCISAQEAYNEIGKDTCVEYYVATASTSKSGNVFLDEKTDYANGFTVTIYYNNVSKFNSPASNYNNRTIDVSGTISQYQGHPEIIVSDPTQITVVK